MTKESTFDRLSREEREADALRKEKAKAAAQSLLQSGLNSSSEGVSF
jgi:hypothetical protein